MILDYARNEMEMDCWQEQIFTTTLREMDLIYLEWLSEERAPKKVASKDTGKGTAPARKQR